MTSEPSRKLILQRLRNRIIETLELAASPEAQLEYQTKAPYIDVPTEVINSWEDLVGNDWQLHYRVGDVFTRREIDAIASFHSVWDEVVDQAPNLPLETLIHTAAWHRLLAAGTEALHVFLERGQLPEDREINA